MVNLKGTLDITHFEVPEIGGKMTTPSVSVIQGHIVHPDDRQNSQPRRWGDRHYRGEEPVRLWKARLGCEKIRNEDPFNKVFCLYFVARQCISRSPGS